MLDQLPQLVSPSQRRQMSARMHSKLSPVFHLRLQLILCFLGKISKDQYFAKFCFCHQNLKTALIPEHFQALNTQPSLFWMNRRHHGSEPSQTKVNVVRPLPQIIHLSLLVTDFLSQFIAAHLRKKIFYF